MNLDRAMLDVTVNAHDGADRPLVSMVIPCYNHAAYVQQSIASIIGQDYENIELIIIDDGSSDDSVQAIQAMFEPCRKRFVRFEFRKRENRGLSATLNEALEWAKGDYFAALASDDLLLPAKTSKLVDCLFDATGVAGAFGGAEVINDHGEIIGTFKSIDAQCGFDEILTHKVIVSAPCQLLDVRALKSVGGYTAGIYIEDWYLWLKLAHAGYSLKFTKDTLVQYRQHDSNISKNIDKMHQSRLQILSAYKNHPEYGFAVAQVYAAAALEYAENEKLKALGYLVEGLKNSLKIAFGYNFIYSCIKVITPKFILNTLKRFIAKVLR